MTLNEKGKITTSVVMPCTDKISHNLEKRVKPFDVPAVFSALSKFCEDVL